MAGISNIVFTPGGEIVPGSPFATGEGINQPIAALPVGPPLWNVIPAPGGAVDTFNIISPPGIPPAGWNLALDGGPPFPGAPVMLMGEPGEWIITAVPGQGPNVYNIRAAVDVIGVNFFADVAGGNVVVNPFPVIADPPPAPMWTFVPVD